MNLGTEERTSEQQAVYELHVVKTAATVKGASAAFNVATGVASATELVDMEFTAVTPLLTAKLNEKYQWISMNYIFVPANQATLEVDYTIETNHGTVTNTIGNIPAQKNYRTNIVGNLLTSKTEYTVNLDARWTDDYNTEVIQEGIVKNANGDYEVTTPSGLAYMLNNLFVADSPLAEGGDFYLTKELYDMTDLDVVAPSVPAGKTLNIYGETPVVTRSTTSFAGITIKGLTQPLIGKVEGVVSVSGVTVTAEKPEEVSVLVEKNEGTVVISETTATTVIAEGNDPVAADDVKDLATLKAALASGVKVIDLAADIEATEVLYIAKSKTINANGKTITSSANRVIRITASNIEVVLNELNTVATRERVGDNDVRGISIDASLENVSLTLNNCSHDFTHATANDWAYAVNVSGSGTGHKVTVNGGTYEGANVVNVHGAKNTVTVKNATLNCTYPANEMYTGACIWVLEEQESSVYAEGNTFNGSNAVAFNLGTGTALEEKDNTDNTQMYLYKTGSDLYYTLAEAIEAIESEGEIKVLHNAEAEAVTTPNGKTITLNLNGKTLEGVDNATGSYGLITNRGNLSIVGPGTMKLTADNNRGWNAYSSVISNTVGGNLTVDGGVVIEHLGGTDMAYGIDNLTNGKGTSAITTVENATVKSPYRAIRQFLNGIEATNELYVNAAAVIEGANKSIWMQDPSTNANTGKLVVAEGAQLKGDVYLFVCAGSTSWPVSASIPASTLKDGSEVMTGNVPEGYTVENVSGVWQIIQWTSVATADELVAALEAKQNVIFANNIKIEPASMSNAYGTTGINVKHGQTINGNGYTLNIKGAGGTWDSGINTTGGVIKNLTVTGSFRGIFINHTSTYSEKVVLENVTIGGNGTVYTISCDQGLYQGIEATNCTFNGWTSFAKTAGEAKFVNCAFGEGSGYAYCRPYSNTEFVGCTFSAGYEVDTTRATVTFTDCTWEE